MSNNIIETSCTNVINIILRMQFKCIERNDYNRTAIHGESMRSLLTHYLIS